MTHRSGPGCDKPRGQQLISTRFYPEPIIIDEQDVRADEAEVQAEREADEGREVDG